MKRIGFTNGTAGIGPNDYVVVDEVGDFSYYPSEAAMLDDLEYVDEAACILDRVGNDYRLTMDKDRHLRLGPSLGTVEFNWLCQAWMNIGTGICRCIVCSASSRRPGRPLWPELFEILSLERARSAAGTPWVLNLGGEETHPATLRDVDGLLARLDHLEQATVRDPFGHEYRPVRHQTHRHLAPGAGSIYYVEIPPAGATSSSQASSTEAPLARWQGGSQLFPSGVSPGDRPRRD